MTEESDALILTRASGDSGKRVCPACEAGRGRALGEKNGLALDVCGDCGTLYARGEKAIPLKYVRYYGESNLSVPEFIGQRCDEIIAAFAPYRKTNRQLDIGCGAGTLLRAARRAGWDTEGLEVSRIAAEHVRAEGFKVFGGELADARYTAGGFDVVTAIEVLEHVADPARLLGEIARILRPGGLFWATTPNGRGLSARVLGLDWSTICPPEHLHLFSLGGARRMAERAGFRRVRVTSCGCNPLEIWHVLSGSNNGAHAHAKKAESAAGNVQKPTGDGFNRVATGYCLNQALLSNPATRAVKAAVNAALGATRLGDSIRIWAEK